MKIKTENVSVTPRAAAKIGFYLRIIAVEYLFAAQYIRFIKLPDRSLKASDVG